MAKTYLTLDATNRTTASRSAFLETWDIPEDWKAAFEQKTGQIVTLLSDYRAEEAAVAPKFSAQGLLEWRQEKVAALAKTLRALEAETVTALDTRLTQERATVVTARRPTDAVDQLRQAEIRQLLAGMDPIVRNAAILAAAESGDDDDLFQAALNAPRIARLVSDELRTKVQEAVIQRTKPLTGDLARLRDMYATVLATARQELGLQPEPGFVGL